MSYSTRQILLHEKNDHSINPEFNGPMSRIPKSNYYDPENPQHTRPMDIDLPSAPQPAAATTTWPSLATDPHIPEYSHHPFLTPGYNYAGYETGPDIRTRTGTGTGAGAGTGTGTAPTQDLTGIPPPGYPHPQAQAIPGPAPKVAIPRAAGSSDISNRSRRRRSPRACEPCRQRKIKCEGTRPACRQCVESHITCLYQDVKRVREQKELGVLGRKVERYEGLLRELEPEVKTGLARRIRRVLKEPEDIENSDEENSSVGSLDAIDVVEEDLNRSEQTRATGFFGKNSEVAWMQKLEAEAQHRSQRTLDDIEETQTAHFFGSGSGKPSQPIPITMVSYYLDDLEIPRMEDVDQAGVPPMELADRFFVAYMESCHPSYNAVRRRTFTTQYRRFIREPGIVRPPKKWLAILNMVFAVGCHYCRLTGEDTGDEDGLVFMTRARKLSLPGDVLFEHSDLQQVQIEFLFAFYLLARGQVNRASKFSNMAFRSALSLGINLRFVDDRTDDAAKEARSRLWWSIYSLEHCIASLTGRVSCASESLSSVPLPIPFDEEAFGSPHVTRLFHDKSLRQRVLKPTLFQTDEESREHTEWLDGCEPCPSLFFFCVVDLVFIAQAVVNKVYSIEGIRERSSRIEKRIRKYAIKMDNWLAKVPCPYRFTRTAGKEATNGDIRFFASENPGTDSIDCAREKFKLAMHFYSSKITLCRPCLTHSDTRSSSPSPNTSTSTSSTSTGPGNTNPNSRSESNPSDPSELTSRSGSNPGAPPNASSTSTSGPAKERHTRFRTEMSLSCLRASCALISLLPDEPDIIRLNRLSPWWELLHFLMQATTALLLGLASWPTSPSAEEKYASFSSTPVMSFSATSSTTSPAPATATLEVPTVVVAAKKALRWLFHMAAAGGGDTGTDSAARRAFVLCDGFMRRIAPSVGVDVDDLPEVGALSALSAHVALGDDVLAGTGAGVGAAAPGTGPGEGGVGGAEGANESEAEMERNEVRFETEMDLEMGLEVGGYREEGDSSSECDDGEEVGMGEG